MGSISVTDCDNLPYGPGQSDYEYDGKVARDMEQMSDLGNHLFEQAALLNDAARTQIQLGRAQMAREVMAWIRRNADALGQAHTETLMGMCQREIK